MIKNARFFTALFYILAFCTHSLAKSESKKPITYAFLNGIFTSQAVGRDGAIAMEKLIKSEIRPQDEVRLYYNLGASPSIQNGLSLTDIFQVALLKGNEKFVKTGRLSAPDLAMLLYAVISQDKTRIPEIILRFDRQLNNDLFNFLNETTAFSTAIETSNGKILDTVSSTRNTLAGYALEDIKKVIVLLLLLILREHFTAQKSLDF